MGNKNFSNGCEKCPDLWACVFSNSYLPVSNMNHHNQKTQSFTMFNLMGICKNIHYDRTQQCLNKCESCPKLENCVLENHDNKKNDDMGFAGNHAAPFLCSKKIQEIYNPNDLAHQRIIFYYKEAIYYYKINKDNRLSDFAKTLPQNALLDYADGKEDSAFKLAVAISEHIKNKIIPASNKFILFFGERIQNEYQKSRS